MFQQRRQSKPGTNFKPHVQKDPPFSFIFIGLLSYLGGVPHYTLHMHTRYSALMPICSLAWGVVLQTLVRWVNFNLLETDHVGSVPA